MPSPARITILWHQDCPHGKELAAELFRWFRGDPADPTEAGRGVPVRYRTKPQHPRRLYADHKAQENADILEIMVPLVGEHMVVDADWRNYLAKEIEPSADLLIPVALDSTAYNLPYRIQQLNFLRLDRATDPGTWSWEQRSKTRRERLVSLLTQVVARELLRRQQADGGGAKLIAPPEINVFISHAKADGVHEAEALRNAIANSGQLKAFFDESDLPIGYRFEERLQDAAAVSRPQGIADTRAMVAIYSDAYASRPWCQRELRLARTPRRSGTEGAASRCWQVKPLVIVGCLERGETRMLSEAGYAPLVGWNPDRISRILDILLREILLLNYNSKRARAILQHTPGKADRHALNCVPDLYTAMAIAHRARGAISELLIPPPGLPQEERELIGRMMAHCDTPVGIKTFDEAELT